MTRIDEQNKPIAVICHGPWLLVSSDLVKGKTLTSYHTIQDDIRNAGGNWVDQETVVDGNWASSRSPLDIPAFTEAVIDLFSQYGGGQAARATNRCRAKKKKGDCTDRTLTRGDIWVSPTISANIHLRAAG